MIPKLPKRINWKKRLDVVFSQYVRMSNADSTGHATCVTCGKREPWKDMDCGHYISRQNLSTRYEEKNCGPQCRHDNRFLEGKKDEFALFLIKKYGVGILEELNRQKRRIAKWNDWTYQEYIKIYKAKIEALEGQ